MTAVYDPSAVAIGLVTNSTADDDRARSRCRPGRRWTVFSPDSTTLYVPTGNAPVTGPRIQVIDVTNASHLPATLFPRCGGSP